MNNKYTIFLIFIALLNSCSDFIDKSELQGIWCEKVVETFIKYPNSNIITNTPYTIRFSNDSIEFFDGIKRFEKDSIIGLSKPTYKGNNTKYKIHHNSISILDPFENNWREIWKVLSVCSDSLVLQVNDENLLVLEKYEDIFEESKVAFDQIIFSQSSCYGSCPEIQMSLNSDNELLFLGGAYVKPLGIYRGTVPQKAVSYIFNKFNQAYQSGLENEYLSSSTDEQAIFTTLVKDKKIVKTILDYGRVSEKELQWAYAPIEYLYSTISLDSMSQTNPFYTLSSYVFYKDSLCLNLKMSESFFLWTELKEAAICEHDFIKKYEMQFVENYKFFGLDTVYPKVERIESDGRYFNVVFENKNSAIYDIGYDFIQNNFGDADFEKIKRW